MATGNQIRKYRDKLGWTLEDLSERCGVKVGSISALEIRDSQRSKYFSEIAKAFGITSDQLEDVSTDWLDVTKQVSSSAFVAIESNAVDAGRPTIIRRTPVIGSARMGSDGYYTDACIENLDGWVDSYSTDKDAYALQVKGDSMHPAIRHGSFVVVEPNGQCVPGEYVAIAMTDGRKMVKELVILRELEVVVESVNGNHRQTLERLKIQVMHPIASVVAASKWRH